MVQAHALQKVFYSYSKSHSTALVKLLSHWFEIIEKMSYEKELEVLFPTGFSNRAQVCYKRSEEIALDV